MRTAVPIAGLAVSGIVFLARRRRRTPRRDDDGCTVEDSAASFTTSAYGDAGSAPRVRGATETHRSRRTTRRLFAWEQGLIVLGLITSLVLGIQKQSWDVVVLMAVLLFICLIQVWRQHNAQTLGVGGLDGESTAGPDVGTLRQPSVVYTPDIRLAGTWIKDGRASDPMNTACDIMCLNGVVRMAVSLVKGLEIQLKPVVSRTDADDALANISITAPPAIEIHVAVFSVISWFKVREHYQLGPGAPLASFNRRDLRRGKHSGSGTVLPDGGVRLDLGWGEPYSGKGYDEFRLETDNELHVTSHLSVGNRKHTYTIVYKRRK